MFSAYRPFFAAQVTPPGGVAMARAEAQNKGNGAGERSASGPRVREVGANASASRMESGGESSPLLWLPPRSDEALALNYVDILKDKLRYTNAWGKWHLFNGQRWVEDCTLQASDYAREVCREAAAGAKDKEAKETASAKKRAAIVSLAREDRRIAATVDQWDSDILLLNTPGGTIDLRTSELKSHRAADYITKMTAVAPGGDCPQWRQFIDEVTGGDAEVAAYLQRIAGYVLSGDTSEHALFFFYGTGSNGKSVFLSTFAGILGDYHRTAPIETFTASRGERHPTDLAMLRGARMVSAVETEEGRSWAESRIKTLTGGDRIAARFMRQDFFEYMPTFKLIVAGNHKPSLRSVDEAIRRRLHLVPFGVTFPPESRDLDLGEKLKKEWPGILQWALDGWVDWREGGLRPPAAVLAATEDYLEQEDAVGAWIEECCELMGEESSSTLFDSWRSWCIRNGEDPRSNKWLSQRLSSRGFQMHKTRCSRKFVGLSVIFDEGRRPI